MLGRCVVIVVLAGCGGSSGGLPPPDAPDGAPGAAAPGGAQGGSSGSMGLAGATGGSRAPSDGGAEAGNTAPTGTDGGGSSVDAGASEVAVGNPAAVPYHAIAVTTGEAHVCALLDDHKVKCWGYNYSGQLGYGDNRDRGASPSDMGNALPVVDLGSGRKVTKISAGHDATCAILDDGTLKCWGDSIQTGLKGNIGDEPGQMGDHLAPLDFGGRKVVDVAVGYYTACAATADESIWCWGDSEPGVPQMVSALPAKSVQELSASQTGVVALYSDGTVSPELLGGSVPLLTAPDMIIAIAGSEGGATCGLLIDGSLQCLSDGTTQSIAPSEAATAVGVGGAFVCAVFADGSVRCPPDNTRTDCGGFWCDAMGTIALGQPATALSNNGHDFVCALLGDGGIKCWGAMSSSAPVAWLGSEISLNGSTYGPWHEVDLGSHLSTQ